MSSIEEAGIGYLISLIARSDSLKPFLTMNDKTPTWDGYIFVYDNSKMKKESLVGRAPVQVKSIEVSRIGIGSVSYPFDIIDLRNYYNERGILLFIVEINKVDQKVFFIDLLASDLKEILDNLKSKDQKSKNIILDELNIDQIAFLETKCRNFLLHRNKQFSTIEYPLLIEEASEVGIHFISISDDIENYIFSNSLPLYGKRKGETVERFIKKINIHSISRSINDEVIINSKIYYPHYEIKATKNGKIFEFGNKITLNVENGNLSFKLLGSITEQILDMVFLSDMIKVGKVEIGNGKLELLDAGTNKEFLTRIQTNLNFLRDIEILFKFFKIDPDILNMDLVMTQGLKNLNVLLSVFVYNNKFDHIPFQLGFNAVEIGNIVLGIFVFQKAGEKNYSIINLFSQIEGLQFRGKVNDNESFQTSPYVFLTTDFLEKVINLNLDLILENIKTFDFSQDYGSVINGFGLELIKAFDKTSRNEFLDAATDIFDWLQEMDDKSSIFKINDLQIIKRKRTFFVDEMNILKNMRSQENGNDRILCGINILLENRSDAENCFELLTFEEKNEFIQYPIFNLAKQLGMFQNT